MPSPLKYQSDNLIDNGLNYGIDNASHIIACEDMPTDYTEATTLKSNGGNNLAQDTITLTGPTDGDSSGRKLTVPAKVGVSVDNNGVMDFQAVIYDAGTELLMVSPMPNAAITAVDTGTNTVTIEGDHTNDISQDANVSIRKKTGDNGTYTVSSVSLNGSDTDVTLNESIGDATADGYMIYGAIKLSDTGQVNMAEFDEEFADAS